MGGFEVFEAITQKSCNPEVPVMVLSVIDSVDIERKLDYPYLLKVVQKPYAMEEMRSDIGRLFDS